MHPRIRAAAGPLLLLAISIGLFWKLSLANSQWTWLNSPDLSTQVLPWLNFQAGEWQHRHFPLWDPYNWGGQSLVGRTEPGVMYPLNWLLFLMPLENGRISYFWLNWYYVLAHYLGALFCYLLCRDLGRSVTASVLAGALFGLGGFLGTNGWPQMVNGVVWAPLVVMFFLRATRGERPLRNMAWAGAAFGVSLLSGHHQAPTFLALLVAGLWLYHFFAAARPALRFATYTGVFALFAFLLGAAQLLPSYEYGKLAVRWVGAPGDPIGWNATVPYTAHANYGLSPVSLLGVVIPGIHPLANPYMGFAAISLALAAAAAWWNRKDVRLFAAIAAGGFLFAIADASFLHGVVYSLVPMVEKARNPSMSIWIFNLGVAVLAALGLDSLAESGPRAAGTARRLAIGLWAVSGVVYLTLFVVYIAQQDRVFFHKRPAAAGLAALLIGVALYAWARQALSLRAARACLLLLALVELSGVAGFEFENRALGWRYLDKLQTNRDIAEFLKLQDGPFRVHVDQEVIPFNFGEWHQIEMSEGNSGVTANIFRVIGERNARMLLGERYSIGKEAAGSGATEVFQAAGGLKVFRNPDAFPRVWAVHRADSVADAKQFAPAIAGPLEELRRRTFVLGPAPQLETCEGDDVRLVERGKNRTVIQAKMACRGMVILADTYFPGWQARVDGKPARIHEAYGFLRGIVVDPGEHRLELRYRPASVLWGAALTLLGFVLALGLALMPSKLSRGDRTSPA